MPSCVFRKCHNYERKISREQGIAYHMFPVDEERLAQWVAAVRAQRHEYRWRPSRSSRVCSAHFREQDKYISEKGRILLRNSALPIVSDDEPVIKVEYEPEVSDDDEDPDVSVSAQGAWRARSESLTRGDDRVGGERRAGGEETDEWAVFARHVSSQLRSLPEASALMAQEEIQSILTRYRLQHLRDT